MQAQSAVTEMHPMQVGIDEPPGIAQAHLALQGQSYRNARLSGGECPGRCLVRAGRSTATVR